MTAWVGDMVSGAHGYVLDGLAALLTRWTKTRLLRDTLRPAYSIDNWRGREYLSSNLYHGGCWWGGGIADDVNSG